MPKPAVYVALRKLALSLSQTLLEASNVFEELSKEQEGEVGAAVLGEIMAKATEVQEAVMEAVAPETPAFPPPSTQLVPISDIAKELGLNELALHKLVSVGKLKKYKSKGQYCVYRSDVSQALARKTRRLRQLPNGALRTSEVAAELQLSQSGVYNLLAEGILKCDRDPKTAAISIRREVLDEYKRSIGLPVTAPTTAVTAAPTATPEPPQLDVALEKRLICTLDTLEEEIGELESCLKDMNPIDRTATVSGWAGQTRKVLHNEQNEETRARAIALIPKLRAIASRYKIWVTALLPGWEIEDWDLYIRAVAATKTILTKDEEEVIQEGNLRALISHPKDVESSFAETIITTAQRVLGDQNALLYQARRKFTPPASSPQAVSVPLQVEPIAVAETVAVTQAEESDPSTAERLIEIPEHILAKTAGKRMLIVGGQGARVAHLENYLERFSLKSCEWFTQEKNSNSLARLAPRVNRKNFDMLVYIASFGGHRNMKLVTTAKKNQLPVMMITRGYSVSSVAQAIESQYSEPPPKAKKPVAKRTVERRTQA